MQRKARTLEMSRDPQQAVDKIAHRFTCTGILVTAELVLFLVLWELCIR